MKLAANDGMYGFRKSVANTAAIMLTLLIGSILIALFRAMFSVTAGVIPTLIAYFGIGYPIGFKIRKVIMSRQPESEE